jgi:uncharacterized protein (TIGR02996 family)
MGEPVDGPDPTLLAAILADPDSEAAWLALAGWLRDNGRDDEAAAVRVFWPALRNSLGGGRTLDWTLEYVRANARRLGREARQFEGSSGADD